MAKTRKKALQSWVSGFDIFGYPIHQAFNFGARSGDQTTPCGGCASILLGVLMLAFIVYKCTFVFGTDKDFVRTEEVPISRYFESA